MRENLAFGLSMRKTPRHVIEERIADTAQLLNIQELLDRKPKDLSGGQRQRVAMGRAMVRKPKLFSLMNRFPTWTRNFAQIPASNSRTATEAWGHDHLCHP